MLDLNVSTIIFQTLNFFILLAILRYFLYKPLLEVMHQREEAIAARVRDAEERAKQADADRATLAAETARIRGQADQLLAAARTEAAESSAKVLASARLEAAQRIESSKQFAAEQERIARQQVAEEIVDSAVSVAGDLIREAAGPTVHASLVEKLTEDNFGLAPDRLDLLRQLEREPGSRISVELAYPPTDGTQQQLTTAIGRTLGTEIADSQIEFTVNPSLVAGARILVGTMAVDLSVAHALAEIKERVPRDEATERVVVSP